MSLLFIMKKFKPLSVKTFVYLFSSTTHSVLKKKVPLINLKKIKEDLEKPLDVEKPSDVDREKPKVEEKVSKAYEKPIKKDKDSLHKYFILKEKEISSKILKCSSEKELLKIYFEENQKKPIHYCLIFYKFIYLDKKFKKLRKLQKSQLKHENKNVQALDSRKLWEKNGFLMLCDKVKERLESMNPDSLNKILQALSLLKKHKPISKEIYKKTMEFILQDQNVLLFDNLQCAKLLILLKKTWKKMENVFLHHEKLARLIINKIKTQIINFPISINLKLYSCFTIIPMKHSKVVEILNKALSKKLYKIKPKELFSILYANYKCCPQEYYLKNENIGFFQTLLKEIEKKSSIEFLNNKQLNLFLEILVSNKFSFPNKNLMIDLIIHQQLNYFTRIIKIKTSIPQEEGEILYLPLFSSFLRKLNEINFQIEEILNLFAFIERQKVNFNVNNYLNMLSFLLNKKESSTSKTLEINNLISFLCFSLSESNLFMIYPENFPNFIECLVRLEGTQDKKITQKILKRAFGFFANAIQKFSDLDLSYSLVFLKSLCEKSDFPILEMLTKAINKHILKTEYHTFEEIEEINKLRANFNENNQIQRISSYLFLKESFNENFKFLIKRHTQIINMCWVCCNLFLKNPQNYELKPSVLWREFTHCLNNVGVPELLTYDNIQKLYEIKILMEINKFLGTDSLFQNPIFVSVFKDQEKFVLSTFLERKKKLRNLLKAEFEQQLQKKDNIKVEICQILNNIIPLDIVISKKNETNIIIQKIAIVIVNINEERNSELINNINAFREYLRIKENYIKSYFGGEVYFIVKEDQCSTLIDEVLPKLI